MTRLCTPAGVVMTVVVLGSVVALFHAWLYKQMLLSSRDVEDWGHAFFVPGISLYLLWQHRDQVAQLRPSVFWPGVAPICLGVMSYAFFIAGVPNHLGQGLALVLTVFGVILLLLGPGLMRLAFLPIGYLVFMITLPEKIMYIITGKLQLIAAQGSYLILSVLQIPTDIKGNQLTIMNSAGELIPLNVAEQCSGMRTLVAFIALAAAVALVASRHWWQRVAVMAMAMPVAILVNVARVAALGIASLWNPELATGEAHTFIGTLLLIPGFGLFMLIVWTLGKCVNDEPAPLGAKGGA